MYENNSLVLNFSFNAFRYYYNVMNEKITVLEKQIKDNDKEIQKELDNIKKIIQKSRKKN